jgi:hypothetical protein
MGLAETAQLLVKLTLQDETSGTASKIKTSLGDLGKTALLAGGAAGFGALTAGRTQAEAAQGKFMAATGKSREEAGSSFRHGFARWLGRRSRHVVRGHRGGGHDGRAAVRRDRPEDATT